MNAEEVAQLKEGDLWLSEPPYLWSFDRNVKLVGFEVEESHEPARGFCTGIQIANIAQLIEDVRLPVSVLQENGTAMVFDTIQVGARLELTLEDFDGFIRPVIQEAKPVLEIACQHCGATYHMLAGSDLFDRTCTSCWLAQQEGRQKVRDKLEVEELEVLEHTAFANPDTSKLALGMCLVYWVALLTAKWSPFLPCFAVVLNLWTLVGFFKIRKHIPVSFQTEMLRILVLRVVVPIGCLWDYRLGLLMLAVEVLCSAFLLTDLWSRKS